MSRLILFPRRNGKTKAGDASAEDVKAAKDGKSAIKSSKLAFPIVNKKVVEEMKISEAEATEDAYKTLRKARSDARYVGKREKRAKDKAEAEDKK
jgi:large subunit ribosomal protein L13e